MEGPTRAQPRTEAPTLAPSLAPIRASWKSPAWTRLASLGAATAVCLSLSGCLFGGDKDEEKIDPNEATAREAVFRTEAEKARDNRFRDRLQRRPRLDAPAGPPRE